MTGLDGRLSDTYEYADFGRTLRSKVFADVSKAEISAVAADTPEANVTQITLSTTFTTDELAGRELFVGGTSAAGHVLANTGSVIYVRDPADAIATALWSGGALRGFAVLDFREMPETAQTFIVVTGVEGNIVYTNGNFQAWHVGWAVQGDNWPETIVGVESPGTLIFAGDQTANFTVDNAYTAVRPGTWDYPINGGVWTGDPSYNDGVTTFTAAGVEDYMTGWTLIPDVTKPCALTVQVADGLAAGGILIVAGDATGLAAAGGVFRVVPPAGVSVSSGALATAQSAGLNTFDDPGCMWLWSGYRYIPPQVGHDIGGTTYGAQPGGNKLGQYYCHHRVYDILTSRWTSPDPAASPWTNLQDYCGGNPVQGRDPSGLARMRMSGALDGDDGSGDTDVDDLDGHLRKGAENTGWGYEGDDDDSPEDILENIKKTGYHDAFVYMGHSKLKNGRGHTIWGKAGHPIAGAILVGGLFGGNVAMGCCGYLLGNALTTDEMVEREALIEASKELKGVAILLSCGSCDLFDDGAFPNAKCGICMKGSSDGTNKSRCVTEAAKALGQAMEGIAAGAGMTWEDIANKMKAHLDAYAAKYPMSGCSGGNIETRGAGCKESWVMNYE